MAIDNFNPEEFGKSLAVQAKDVVPDDLSQEQKNYVVNKVYQFSILAGNALNQDTSLSFNADQSCTISQFIAEWTFHKSIDLIRSGLAPECWDQVLQEIAFAIFEKAKQLITQGIPQDQLVGIIEQEVRASYEKALYELSKSGKLDEEDINNVLSYSNIDKMADESNANAGVNKGVDEKTAKLASIAVMLKALSDIKREKILSSLDPEDAEKIRNLLQIPDLETKLNPNVVDEFLRDFRKNIPSIKRFVYSQSNNIMSLKEHFTEIEIKNAVKSERKKIRDYIDYCLVDLPTSYMSVELSQMVSNIIDNYVKSKLYA
jgi:hypothetical protein